MIISNSVDASLCYPYKAISYIVLDFFIVRRHNGTESGLSVLIMKKKLPTYYITSDILTLSRSGLCYLLTSNSC
jgi:hypothetical protein